MKCFKCGTEYDDRFCHLCPHCYSEQPRSKAIKNKIWQTLFSLLNVAIFLLAMMSIDDILGKKADIVLFFPLLFLWIISYGKTKDIEADIRGEKISNLLQKHDEHLINGEDSKAAIVGGEICSIARDKGPH